MHRFALACGCLCFATLVSACGGTEPRTVPINEEGCVTASGNEFILTDLHPGEPNKELKHLLPEAPRARPTTEAYLLTGDEERLRSLAGRQVRVAGVVDPLQVAELRSLSPLVAAAPPPDSSGNDSAAAGEPAAGSTKPDATATSGTGQEGVTPKVATQHQLRMEIHRLRVRSIEPTGDACGAMTGTGS